MVGAIEKILRRRFGLPTVTDYEGFVARTWNCVDEARRCQLLLGTSWDKSLGDAHDDLRSIYGDSFGGFILHDSLRLSSLIVPSIWGLYRIDELHARPEVQRALTLDPTIDFFMDAANVWFYGCKEGELYCYDAEFDEFESLGEVEPAIDELVSLWLQAKERNERR